MSSIRSPLPKSRWYAPGPAFCGFHDDACSGGCGAKNARLNAAPTPRCGFSGDTKRSTSSGSKRSRPGSVNSVTVFVAGVTSPWKSKPDSSPFTVTTTVASGAR